MHEGKSYQESLTSVKRVATLSYFLVDHELSLRWQECVICEQTNGIGLNSCNQKQGGTS